MVLEDFDSWFCENVGVGRRSRIRSNASCPLKATMDLILLQVRGLWDLLWGEAGGHDG